MVGITLPESGYYFLITRHSSSSRVVLHFSYQYVRSYPSDCIFNSVAINANSIRDLVSEEAITTSTPPYAFVNGRDFNFILIFKNMHSPPPSRGVAARRGPWPHYSRRFQITQNDAPNSVGLLCTSDQLAAQTCT
jgi:hypothetical protein